MPTTVASYIIDRLAALGARHVFGVPGNYTAEFLSAIDADRRLKYVGTTNELEAGYAADALSRTERIGVVCVTYGVGSFSLYNAIAGAYVERCPVVLVNGIASAAKVDQLVRQGVKFAHAIDTLRTDEAIFRPVCADTAAIADPRDAPAQFDRVLRACVAESLPVYLEVPDGMWSLPCTDPANPPANTPLAPIEPGPGEKADIERATAAAVAEVVARARRAKHPVLWGGEWLQRLRLGPLFAELVRLTGWPYTTTLLGKALIGENNPHFMGVYDSGFAPADVKKVVEGTDCLIALGTILSDFYGPIVGKHFDQMILAAGRAVRVGDAVYPNVPLAGFLKGLVSVLRPPAEPSGLVADKPRTANAQTPPPGFGELRAAREARRKPEALPQGLVADDAPLTCDAFFALLRQQDWTGWRMMVDTSMALFPSAEIRIDEPDHFIAQTAWLSIGYTTGAAVGASFASDAARVVAIAGDGGFQMIPQVLSTLVRNKVARAGVLFVLDNGLYAIEQYLIDKTYFGPNPPPPRFFNILPTWDYEKLAAAFGAKGKRVGTVSELRTVLNEIKNDAATPVLVAVKLAPTDLPAELRATVAGTSAPAGLADGAPSAPTVAEAAFN